MPLRKNFAGSQKGRRETLTTEDGENAKLENQRTLSTTANNSPNTNTHSSSIKKEKEVEVVRLS